MDSVQVLHKSHCASLEQLKAGVGENGHRRFIRDGHDVKVVVGDKAVVGIVEHGGVVGGEDAHDVVKARHVVWLLLLLLLVVELLLVLDCLFCVMGLQVAI